MGLGQYRHQSHLRLFIALAACVAILFTGCSESASGSSQRPSGTEKTREVYTIEDLERVLGSGDYGPLSSYYQPAMLPENVRLQTIELTQTSIICHYAVQEETTAETEESEDDTSSGIKIISAEEAEAVSSSESAASGLEETEQTESLDEAARLQQEMERQKREYVFAWDWRNDGQSLLENSKQHYGTETEIYGITYYQYMLQGNGEILAYQYRWVEDGHLFYLKIPASIADSVSQISDFLKIEEIPV